MTTSPTASMLAAGLEDGEGQRHEHDAIADERQDLAREEQPELGLGAQHLRDERANPPHRRRAYGTARRSNGGAPACDRRSMVGTRGRAYLPAVLNLAIETQAYQALLEGHRADPDNEDLYTDLQKARAAMEIAWLQLAVAVGE